MPTKTDVEAHADKALRALDQLAARFQARAIEAMDEKQTQAMAELDAFLAEAPSDDPDQDLTICKLLCMFGFVDVSRLSLLSMFAALLLGASLAETEQFRKRVLLARRRRFAAVVNTAVRDNLTNAEGDHDFIVARAQALFGAGRRSS